MQLSPVFLHRIELACSILTRPKNQEEFESRDVNPVMTKNVTNLSLVAHAISTTPNAIAKANEVNLRDSSSDWKQRLTTTNFDKLQSPMDAL